MRAALHMHARVSAGGRTGRVLAALVSCVLLLATVPSAGEPVLLDEVVAVVAGKFQGGVPPRVMTRWDLEAECRLESIQRYGPDGVDRLISKSLRAAVLERMIDESVILREAIRLDGAHVEEDALDEAFDQVAQVVGEGDEFVELLDEALLSREKVRSILVRRIVAERYVLDSLRLSMSFTESEVEAAFKNMDHPFDDRELDEVREEFVDYLIGVLAHQHRDELIEDLSTRCHIWVFINPGGSEA